MKFQMILQDAINTQVNKQTDCDLTKKVSCDIPRQNSNSDIFSRNNESETEKIKFSPSLIGVFIFTYIRLLRTVPVGRLLEKL